MSRVRNAVLVMMSASALSLAGCGSSSGNASSTATTTTGAQAPSTTNSTAAAAGSSPTITSVPPKDRSPAGTPGKAPTVVVPSGSPPSGLESADLIDGKGAAAKPGDAVEVEYVLATYSSRKVIQSSWSSQPYQFTLGEGQVIPGWDYGVVGMRVGGRRELIIPPSLGYGATSPGAGIAANDTLVFVIDLLKVG